MNNAHQPPIGPQFTAGIFARIGVDRYTVTASRLGDVCVGWTGRGVSAIRLGASAALETEFVRWYESLTGRPIVRAVELDAIGTVAQTKLRTDAGDVPLDFTAATALQREVYTRVGGIKFGQARPCELLAGDVGRATDGSTIAAILEQNPIPLLVPCHRVVSANRCVGSYVFGPDAQRRLLQSEGLDLAAIERVVARGFRYIGCADGSFCLPTCGDVARRVDAPGYLGLHSISEAHEHGLAACESCRPVAA